MFVLDGFSPAEKVFAVKRREVLASGCGCFWLIPLRYVICSIESESEGLWPSFRQIGVINLCVLGDIQVYFRSVQASQKHPSLFSQKHENNCSPVSCFITQTLCLWFLLPAFPLFTSRISISVFFILAIEPVGLRLKRANESSAESQHSADPLWPATQDVPVEEKEKK